MGTTASTSTKTSIMDKARSMYETEDTAFPPSSQSTHGQRFHSTPHFQPDTSTQDHEYQLQPLKMYGASVPEPRYGREEADQLVPDTDHETSSETPLLEREGENTENPLYIDENTPLPDVEETMTIFPKGEHAFQLGEKGRFAVIQTLGFGVFVSLREHFQKPNSDGILQWYPTKKGIHLRVEEWRDLAKQVEIINRRLSLTETKVNSKLQRFEERFVKKRANVPYNPTQTKEMKRSAPTPIGECSYSI